MTPEQVSELGSWLFLGVAAVCLALVAFDIWRERRSQSAREVRIICLRCEEEVCTLPAERLDRVWPGRPVCTECWQEMARTSTHRSASLPPRETDSGGV